MKNILTLVLGTRQSGKSVYTKAINPNLLVENGKSVRPLVLQNLARYLEINNKIVFNSIKLSELMELLPQLENESLKDKNITFELSDIFPKFGKRGFQVIHFSTVDEFVEYVRNTLPMYVGK